MQSKSRSIRFIFPYGFDMILLEFYQQLLEALISSLRSMNVCSEFNTDTAFAKLNYLDIIRID